MWDLFAISLSSEIEKYGAYAGFAAIPGLALLALLYFAQAREVKRLREWAGRAPERAQELQDRVVSQAQQGPPAAAPAQTEAGRRVVAQPAGAGTPAAARGAQPGQPKPPGTGAPVPAPAQGAAAAKTPAPATPGAPAAKPGQPATPGAKPAVPGAKPAVPAKPAAPAKPGQPAAVPAAATAAGATPAAPPKGPGTQTPSPAGGDAPTIPPTAPARTGAPTAAPPRPASDRTEVRPAAAAAAARTPAAQLRRQPASRAGSAPPRRRDDGRGDGEGGERDPRRIIGIGVGVVVGVALVVLLVTQVFGGGGDSEPASEPNTVAGQQSQPANTNGASTPVNRGDVTVAVLNGTTVPGLAAQVADQLQGGGFARGQVTNAADQQRAETTVQFAPNQRPAAEEVATLLKLPKSSVKALDANTQAIAGPDAEVVVTVGADRTQ